MPTSRRPRIAFQGAPGAFSEDAIRAFWGDEATSVPCQSFADALEAVRHGNADGAVIPVENLVAGPVTPALDAIDDHSDGLSIGGSTEVPIVHALMSVPGSSLDQLRLITSHPIAILQCRKYLDTLGVRVEEFFDTAGAARMVRETGDPSIAAVASHNAARRYGLEVLVDAIQDVPDNWTRFVKIEATGA